MGSWVCALLNSACVFGKELSGIVLVEIFIKMKTAIIILLGLAFCVAGMQLHREEAENRDEGRMEEDPEDLASDEDFERELDAYEENQDAEELSDAKPCRKCGRRRGFRSRG